MFETITVIIMATLIITACIWGWWSDNHANEVNDSEDENSKLG